MKKMKLKELAVVSLVIIVSMLVYPVIAQSTTISIEDIQVATSGDNDTVPIYINDVTDPDGVGTVQFNLIYDPSVVHVTGTDDSNTDFSLVVPNVDNSAGVLRVGGTYFGSPPGPTDTVRVIDVTFTAVGSVGESSILNITDTLLKDATPDQNDILHDVDNGTFTIGVVVPVVINEFIPDPEGDDDAPMPDGEWVELYNKGGTDINVSGCVLYDSNDTHELYITSENTNTGDTIVPANGWLVVYRDGDSDFSLNRNDDEVRLYDGYPVADSNLIDETSYANSTTGKSWARIPDGTGDFVEAPPTPGVRNPPEGIKIVFITDPQTIMAGEPSDVMTIQTQDELGNPVNVETNTTINLSSDSEAGTFSLTADPWEEVTEVTIIAGGNMAGGNMASFYYTDVTVGTPTLTAAESPDQNWTDATQEQTINPANISKIVFTTDPQTIMVGEPSNVTTIQTQDEYDNPSNVEADTTIALSSDSGTGTFSLTADPWEEVTEVTIIAGGNMAGGNMASFYYKDVTVGKPTLTAAESPDQGWTDATQQQTIGVEISKLVFITDPQTINVSEPSDVMTIQTQDELGNPANVEANTTINLSSSSGTGTFSLAADPWEEVTEVTIIAGGNMAGGNMASFYYKDETAGTPTITAAESPDQGWTDATQQQNVSGIEEYDFEITLSTGWHLISIPWYIDPSDVQTIRETQELNFSITEYNTATGLWETPDKLQPLHGYSINMYEAGTIGFTKSKLHQVPPSRELKTGWNQIGPSFGDADSLDEGLDATTVLSSLREDGYTTFSHLVLYDETTGTYTTYDATVKWEDLYEAWNGLKLYPGQGCWISMLEDDTLSGRL